jgi:hypothetical protein
MVRFKIILILLMVTLVDAQMFPFRTQEARAIVPLAAPAAAIGSLELAALTVTTAAALGIISASQNREFQAQISEKINHIKNATTEMVNDAVDEAFILLKSVAKATKTCSPQVEKESRHSDCTSSPEACCGDYFSKFSDQIDKGHGGFKIHKSKGKNKILCCLEWDHTHGGFEVFDEHGKHLGERGCDDMNDDPCSRTPSRGRHSQPNTTTHHPRTAACRK